MSWNKIQYAPFTTDPERAPELEQLAQVLGKSSTILACNNTIAGGCGASAGGDSLSTLGNLETKRALTSGQLLSQTDLYLLMRRKKAVHRA